MLKPFLFVFKNLKEGKGIPHGGLKTSPEKPENQNFNPLKIEIAHREGTLTHIQLPS
jgi:hypothetical protein